MSDEIRVIQYGLGPIGSTIARHITQRSGLKLVGTVDIDSTKVGRDAGEVIGLGKSIGFLVTKTLDNALANTEADVVVHTTSSNFDLFEDQIIDILDAKLNIVSTAEELSFPFLAHPEEAARVNQAAQKAGKTVLGTGVNPGFLMDCLPLNLTAICQRVDRIEVTRSMNASFRRGPFQSKIGSGMTITEFENKVKNGRIGHVGLKESMDMVFHTLGKKLIRTESSIEPILADAPVKTDFIEVKPGDVRGINQVARGFIDESEFMTLTFIAALDEPLDQTFIKISGKPDLELTLKGANGDIATVAMAVNAIRRVKASAPGLVTMADLPIVTFW
jgi:hypothetical protein